MNPEKRAKLLGEDFPKRSTPEEPEFTEEDPLKERLSRISEDTKKKISEVKKFVRAKDQEMGGSDLNLIFKGDKDKIERYKMFVWEKNGKIASGIPPGNLSYNDLKKEKEEFEQIYQMFHKDPSDQEAIAEFQMTEEQKRQSELLQKIEDLKNKIQKEKNRRRVEYWLPDRILCRRFNVPQPQTHKVILSLQSYKSLVHRTTRTREKERYISRTNPACLFD